MVMKISCYICDTYEHEIIHWNFIAISYKYIYILVLLADLSSQMNISIYVTYYLVGT